MAESDEEIERLWEGEEEQMAEEDKDWLIQRLREKVHDLKEQLRLISTLGHGSITGDSGPLAHLVFFNNIESMSNRYRMEMLIRSLANSVRGSQLQVEALTHYHQPSAVLISSTGGESGDEEEEGEEEEVCVVGSVEYYVDFCLDWRGIPVREVGGGVDGGKRIEWKPNEETAVLYGQVYLEPFWVDVVGEREERRRRRMGIACFNCGDDHHIKDCPEPKDLFRINVRRQEYLASLGTVGADRRYHMTSGDDRFKKFVPGKISEKLRKAIGLMNETDYPPYIYRMRALDYPPGYRILARERGLRMYDSADDAQDKDNEDTMKREDIIIYPGFNSPDVLQSTAPSYKLGCGGPPPISCTTTSEVSMFSTLTQAYWRQEQGEVEAVAVVC
ncbi:Zinc finger CCHC domain-containing protein 8 [Geodia barretti]|uniref:Zinc finger CCHC domain-containing protein 8 n=1 Tax=Geodia barretti TaxID=519541 RepID=A0AA35WUM3_GEOBA|nr:Zinc finger CCHC domain-containing protein 8 [Geodia barretti]